SGSDELPPDAVGGQGTEQGKPLPGCSRSTEQSVDCGYHKDHGGSYGGYGIPRQAEDEARAAASEHQRSPGAHRDAPEADVHSGFLKCRLNEIVFADACAAGSDKNIRVLRKRRLERFRESSGVVLDDAQVAGFSPGLSAKCCQCYGIRR